MNNAMPVATTDPDIERQLRDRADHLSSRELAEFAHSLGVHPPGYAAGRVAPPLVLTWPPGADLDASGVLVWDMRLDED